MACFHFASILLLITISILVSCCNSYNYCGPQALFVYSDKPKHVKKKKRLLVAAEPSKAPVTKMATRLTTLRRIMASQSQPIAAYIIPTSDAHHSEYISPTDARREWVTGFTGSAGSAIVTQTDALLWTDGRYWTQFLNEADTAVWTLMKQGLPDTPSMEKWLSQQLPRGSVVGADATTLSRDEWAPMEKELATYGIALKPTATNLVDAARLDMDDPPPTRPRNDITPLSIDYTGRSAGDKIKDLRKQMEEKKTSALVLTALDEIAYLINLRGKDVQYNPVFFSYLVLTRDKVKLFWGDGFIPEHVTKHLEQEGVTIEGGKYKDIETYLVELAQTLSSDEGQTGEILSTWVPSESSEAIHRAASGESVLPKPLTLISGVSPVALMKLYKNDVELEGFRQCHIRDGTAVVRFLHWLEREMQLNNTITEVQASDKILEFRQQEKDFMGPSFETISATGANAAIIHYTPNPQDKIVINKDTFYLVDSGGHYRDGTTDITRTRHYGVPSSPQRDGFTRALRGQIALGAALFPPGVKGNTLDTLARKALWDVGLDYAHGTGHGVGHYLNVHEGPAGVSWRPYPQDPGLAPRIILSNEPGYYKDGHYGIRHEDLVEIVNVTETTEHPRSGGLKGDFAGRGVLGFNTITMVPHQRSCIDVAIMDDFEIAYLNSYHQTVLTKLKPILLERGLNDVADWLDKECQPIVRQQTTQEKASKGAKYSERNIKRKEAKDLGEKKSEEYERHGISTEKSTEQARKYTENSTAKIIGENELSSTSTEKSTEQTQRNTEDSVVKNMGENTDSISVERTEHTEKGTGDFEVEITKVKDATSAEKETEQAGKETEHTAVKKMGEDSTQTSSAENTTEKTVKGTENKMGESEINDNYAEKKMGDNVTQTDSAEKNTKHTRKDTENHAEKKIGDNVEHTSSAENDMEQSGKDTENYAVKKMEESEMHDSFAENKVREYDTHATSTEITMEQALKDTEDVKKTEQNSAVNKMGENEMHDSSAENTTEHIGKDTEDSVANNMEELQTPSSSIKVESAQENITETLKYTDDDENLLTVKKGFIQTNILKDKITSTPFPFIEIELQKDDLYKKYFIQTDKLVDKIISTPFPFNEVEFERDDRFKNKLVDKIISTPFPFNEVEFERDDRFNKGFVKTDKVVDKIISTPFPYNKVEFERDDRFKNKLVDKIISTPFPFIEIKFEKDERGEQGFFQTHKLNEKVISTPFPFNEIELGKNISLDKGDQYVEDISIDRKESIENTEVDGKIDENVKKEANKSSFLTKFKKSFDKVFKKTKGLKKGKKVLNKLRNKTKGFINKTPKKIAIKKNKFTSKAQVSCACDRNEDKISPSIEQKKVLKNSHKRNKTMNKIAIMKNKILRKFNRKMSSASNRNEDEISPSSEKKKGLKNSQKVNKTMNKITIIKNKLLRKFAGEVSSASNRNEDERSSSVEEKKEVGENTKKFNVKRFTDLLPFTRRKQSDINRMECKSCFGE